MEIHYINNSVIQISKGFNASGREVTIFKQCEHMPAIILFYLGLQFVNMFLGIPANLMVLWLLHKNKADSSTSDIFTWHLAVLDTLFCLILPLELANITYLTSSSPWYVLRFFYGIKDSSSLFLSCICLDRYMAVVHPITFAALKDRQHRSVCAAVVWVLTLAYAAAKCVGTIVKFEKAFTVMILANFTIMLFCNISILFTLRRSGPARDVMHPVKKKAFKMVLIILTVIIFNYLPPVALFPFQDYFSHDVFHCYIYYLAFGFMDISITIQPMLYLSKEKLSCPPRCCCKRFFGQEMHEVST
ncbi:hydroxycarboxylic acid receptor 2-like [Paramormyrops kingsleyae]|uniref:hydroxycarboxylic acid receptor 2-like n=1 Tax=Paramormyrops kingsleyae TaxID=1676925 RepID=UPI003B96A16A